MPIRHLLVSCVLLVPALGCSYAKNRGLDFAQTVNLSVGISEGLEFNLRATKFVQVGFGGYRGLYWAGLKDGLFDTWHEERSEFGVGPFYIHEVFRAGGHRLLDIRYPLFGDPGFREYAIDLTHLSDRGVCDVGFTANFVFLGIDASFNSTEFADFLCGVVNLDPLQDDPFGVSRMELTHRLSGADARVRAAAARALRLRFNENHGYVVYGAPDEIPTFEIQAIRRWREALGTLAEDSLKVPLEESLPASPADPQSPSGDTENPNPPDSPSSSPPA